MTLYEATLQRHSVRSYIDKALDADVVAALNARIAEINTATGLHIQLVLNEPVAFQSKMAKYGSFRNVSSYLVMAGRPSDGFEEAVGYYGEQLVLMAQTMGVNSCWVGLTYQKVDGAYELAKGEKIACVIALGYGADAGRQHRSKEIAQVSNLGEGSPAWFRAGVMCALNAPTAVNQQKFYFELQADGKTVKAQTKFSMVGYARMDLGIAKLHFELGAAEAAAAEWCWA